MRFRATIGSMPAASDVAPLPRLGEVFFDVRGNSRTMRLSWYAETGVAVFSIWQGGTCTGTFRVPITDVPRLADALQRGPGGAAAPALEVPGTGATHVQGPEASESGPLQPAGGSRGVIPPGQYGLYGGPAYSAQHGSTGSAQHEDAGSRLDRPDPAARPGFPGHTQNGGHAEPAMYGGHPDPGLPGGHAVPAAHGGLPDPRQQPEAPGQGGPLRDAASYSGHPGPNELGMRSYPYGGYSDPAAHGERRDDEGHGHGASGGGHREGAPHSGYPDAGEYGRRSEPSASGGNPDMGHAGYPEAGHRGCAQAGHSGYAQAGHAGNSQPGHGGYPQTGEHRRPAELPGSSAYQDTGQFSRPAESSGHAGHPDSGSHGGYFGAGDFGRHAGPSGGAGYQEPAPYRGYAEPRYHGWQAAPPIGGNHTEPRAYGGHSETLDHGGSGNAGEYRGYKEAGTPPPSDQTSLAPGQPDPGPPTIAMTPPAGIPAEPSARGGEGRSYPPDRYLDGHRPAIGDRRPAARRPPGEPGAADPRHAEEEPPGTVPYGYPPSHDR